MISAELMFAVVVIGTLSTSEARTFNGPKPQSGLKDITPSFVRGSGQEEGSSKGCWERRPASETGGRADRQTGGQTDRQTGGQTACPGVT